MRALCFARPLVALAIAGVSACSIWAALSNPYKTDTVSDASAGSGAASDAGARDAKAWRLVDSGISPVYAIAAYGDAVYVVGYHGEVQVAHGTNSGFSTLWMADPNEVFVPQRNGVSVSAAGVFWTVSGTVTAGIHFCALDGGACGFLPSAYMPQAIAASDTAVVWVDRRGVESCSIPLDSCTPTTLPASKGAGLVTAGPSTLAWADGGPMIHVDTSVIDLGSPHAANAMGIDRTSGDLYWENRNELGAIYADGAAYTDGSAVRIWPLGDQGSSPVELFASAGVVYWSTFPSGGSTVFYCHVDSDAGCIPAQLSTMGVGNANYGIVANSRNVLAIVGSTVNSPPEPELAAWPLPH
jgi:hypothetical protein